MQASITSAPFGALPDGRQTTLYTLTNRQGMVARITDYGGIIVALHAPDRLGHMADVVLGFDDVAAYAGDSPYFGALIGRYGNRIRDGRFSIDGRGYQLPVNNGANHLHGGPEGYHRVLWRARPAKDGSAGLVLEHTSVDGEQGYPGTLDVTVTYTLTDDNALRVAFRAVTDQPTPVNLTQHSYFNLAGDGDILGHVLTLQADGFTPIDAGLIPTGEIAAVAGTAFDFRLPQAIGARIGDGGEQLQNGSGYDHNFVLAKPARGGLSLAARVHEPVSGRVLELHTEEPGVQFYSGNFLDGTLGGKGRQFSYRSGFCLEPQHFPDSPNQAHFPNTILRPGQEYATVSLFKFLVEP